MQLTVNGSERHIPDAWRDETLLSTLREYLGLVGAKYSCGIGLCGARHVRELRDLLAAYDALCERLVRT